ncbi:retropepsin-like aspartic protease [Sphingosinithalassobacter portus]|uniref:retropepsin-like aspartic protease n=1 Tax=Stakelama portus TaxID=2676234 RepID=UPI000D6DCEBA|nr:retropepsin-like aspartic protease [Sphingosinithalassobacter portus]
MSPAASLSAAVLFFAGIAPASAQPVTEPAEAARSDLPVTGEITLFQSPGRVLVMMRVGDGDLLPMVFDTGSDGNTIDLSLVDRLKLERIGEVQEVDGSTGHVRILPSVALRELTVGGLPVGSIDAAAVEYDRNDAMGIFSSETFTQSLLYLDLASGRAVLTARDAATRPAEAPIDYVDGLPTVHMVMPDGGTMVAHFDTGFDGALSLPLSMIDKVPLEHPAQVVGRFRSISQEGDVYGGRIRGTVRIGPVVLENPEVTFLGDIANIGLPILRKLTLVIDAEANRNWVLAPGSLPEGDQ